MIAIIGGPSKDEGKKPEMSMTMKSKPKKIGGIGGEFASEADNEGPGMDNQEKMLEAARPLARAMGVPSSTVVECITTICNLMESENSEGDKPTDKQGGE